MKFNLWDVWFCCVLACVVACSDSSSGASSDEIEPDEISSGSQIGIDGEGNPVSANSSAVIDDPQNPQGNSSSSKKSDGSHDGPLPGEDPDMVPVDTTVPFIGNFPVIFSEVSPSNANFKDNDGNDPGWLELYNTSDAPVSLKGIALSAATRSVCN